MPAGRFGRVVATAAWILVFGLVFLTTLYFGGARSVVAGPAYLVGACLWLLLGFQAVVGIIQKRRSVDLVDLDGPEYFALCTIRPLSMSEFDCGVTELPAATILPASNRVILSITSKVHLLHGGPEAELVHSVHQVHLWT